MGVAAFGDMFRRLRLEKGLSLREFCRRNGLDPGNISKLERGRLAPPGDRGKIEGLARMLGLAKGADAWREFVDLGLVCAGRIPDEVLSDEEVVKRLPVVLRTVSGARLTEEQLDDLVDKIRKA
jgi:transcriptional regulator with XRE-family HTH domain